MFKRGLVVLGFLFLLVIIFVQSAHLELSWFVFFPAMIFAIYFFMEDEYRFFFPAAILLTLLSYGFYTLRHLKAEAGMLGLQTAIFFILLLLYRNRWNRKLVSEGESAALALKDFENLKQKHHSRLESLHHLERQVAGLLNLFEIARDFNDCLDFKSMVDILYHRVLPELPFSKFKLILLEKSSEGTMGYHVFTVVVGGMEEAQGAEALDGKEKEWIERIAVSRKMLQTEGRILFPLITDGVLAAALLIEGNHPEDLAKFEVLAAYMSLQVRKVHLYQTVRELSIRDGLTDLFIRRHFMDRFREEIKRSIKHQLPMAVLMLDIDHFKRYNDEHGHLAGDATLKQVARLLRENLRKVDLVGRYGGEEFIIVLPEARRNSAAEVAERIRSNIARHNFMVYNNQTRVTVSIGLTLFPDDVHVKENSTEQDLAGLLIQEADKALYRAKDEGRNRVIFAKENH